jgi:hypothetical protein
MSFGRTSISAAGIAAMLAVSICAVSAPLSAQSETGVQNTAPQPAGSQGQAALDKASKANRYLFIFFHKPGGGLTSLLGADNSAKTQSLANVFGSAMEKVSKKADSVSVNIADPNEKDFVKKFDVSRAPMPLVLSIAPNGAITDGFPGKFTEAELLDAFATPGLEKALKVLQSRKLLLLCFQNSTTTSNEAAMKGVKEFKADPKFGPATEIVTVDPAAPEEAKLVKEFKIEPGTKEAVTVFLAPPGTNLATYKGATDKQAMVAKVTSSVAGCGTGCKPGACGPAQ